MTPSEFASKYKRVCIALDLLEDCDIDTDQDVETMLDSVGRQMIRDMASIEDTCMEGEDGH